MKLLTHSQCPGKLILSGEHSTVYKKNAVAVTVDLYTEIKVYSIEDTVQLYLCNLDDFEKIWSCDLLNRFPPFIKNMRDFEWNESTLCQIYQLREDLNQESPEVINACTVFLLLYLSIGNLSDRQCIRVEVTGDLPYGAGLGSSSSYIVSMTKAIFNIHELKVEEEVFNKWCFELEKIFHGKPSGVDNTICTYGGAILFGDGKILERISPKNVPKLEMILVDTNVPRNTRHMIERCRKRKDLFPKIGNQIVKLLGSISQEVWTSLKTRKLKQLPVLFEMNHNLLNCLDVGHHSIETIINIAKENGYSAKLTGAGGGGVVMIYITNENSKATLRNELQSKGFTIYIVKLGVKGAEIIFG